MRMYLVFAELCFAVALLEFTKKILLTIYKIQMSDFYGHHWAMHIFVVSPLMILSLPMST